MTRYQQTAVLAAAMGLGSIGLTSIASAQNMMPPGEPTARPPLDGAIRVSDSVQLPNWPAGFVAKPVDDQAGLYKPIANATEAALTRNGFKDFVERLSEPDRDRIRKTELDKQSTADLNNRIGELREKFKQKYASEFDISDPGRVFDSNSVQVAVGEVSDPNLARDRFPVPARDTGGEARMASGRIEAPHPEAQGDQKPIDPYLTTGRKVALVGLKGTIDSMPPMNLSLAHEFLGSWKIDIPDSVTGRELQESLLKHLTMLNDDSPNWPQSVNDAKRLFVQHVMAAVYDINAPTQMRDTADGTTQLPPKSVDPSQKDRLKP